MIRVYGAQGDCEVDIGRVMCEAFTLDAGAWMSSQAMYRTYLEWARLNGVDDNHVITSNGFGRAVTTWLVIGDASGPGAEPNPPPVTRRKMYVRGRQFRGYGGLRPKV